MKTESEKQQEKKELEKISHQKIGNLFFFKTEKWVNISWLLQNLKEQQ